MDYQTKEYYFEHPEVMKSFSKSDWMLFLEGTDDFDLTGECATMSDVEFAENIKFMEDCGGKLFIHYYLLGFSKQFKKQLPNNTLNYLDSLNKDLEQGDMQLLNAVNGSDYIDFECLPLDLGYFCEYKTLRALNKYAVKRFVLFNNDHRYLMIMIEHLVSDNWELVGSTFSEKYGEYSKEVLGLEFKKVEEQKEEK